MTPLFWADDYPGEPRILHCSRVYARASDDWVDEIVERSRIRTEKRMSKPLRVERGPINPRCQKCGEFLTTAPVRFIDGIAYHRACLGDAA